MFKAYTHFLHRFRWSIAFFSILLFVFCAREALRLELHSDFKELLPDNFQSVKDMDRILARVKSTDTLVVGIESDDAQASIRFALALIEKLKTLPKEYVQQVDYNVSVVKKFFEKNKYLYIDTPDLQDLHDRLKKRINREKVKGTGLFLDLETKSEKDEEFSTSDVEDKYKSKTSRYDDYIDGYFFGEKGRLMALVIRPSGAATGVDFARRLVANVDQTIHNLNPASFHPSIKVGLTGKFRRVLFVYQTLIDDIVSTSALVVLLVGLAVFLYFGRFRMVFLMAGTVFNGVAWTFALTKWHIGYLTTQTAFLGAIIVGNGINYSLILMARYLEERKQGLGPMEALHVAIPTTFFATLASSITTAVTFGVLIFTQIKGFSHFGFIGGIGIFLCWVATYTLLPVFLIISESIRPMPQKERFSYSLMAPLADKLPAWSKNINRVGAVLTLGSLLLLIFYIPNSLEYDFDKLNVKPRGKQVSDDDALNERIRKIFSDSMTPAVLVTERIDQVKPLCDEILRKKNLDPSESQVIDDCKSAFSHLPENQDEKIAILKNTRGLLEDSTLDFLNADQKKEMEKFKKEFTAEKIILTDLPEEIIRNYREKNGMLGRMVFVYPTDRAPLWNGKNLIRFADIIRENKLPTGEIITASGTAVIFADLLRAVAHDGPRATLFAFLAVFLVVGLIFREKRAIIFIMGTLILGFVWMMGLVALLNIKLNFFNFIAIPVTFGIGVDYGVNIYQRYKQEGKGSLVKVLKTTGGAVALCSLTTLIGYATLIVARNKALVSFGWLGILGELGCLACALIFIPAVVIHFEKSGPDPNLGSRM